MSFQEKYCRILNIVKPEIDSVLDKLTYGVEVQEPLKSELFKILKAPAKHIRPLVSFLYLKAAGYDINEKQIIYQSAIELVHNASLIHDDVIDEATKRRSKKTLNTEFGNKLSIISGDYLLAVALKRVLKIESVEIIKMFADTLAVMSQGEINQHFTRFEIPSIEEYIKKSEQKTAKLFETAICGSLIIANSSVNGLNFAKNFGIAFQIRDDLINCETVQTDIKDGIYTAPVIFSGSINNINSGIEKTRILLDNYIVRALDELKKFEDNIYKKALEELLGLLKNG